MKKEIRNALVALVLVVAFLSTAYFISQNRKANLPKLPFYGEGLVISPSEYNPAMDSLLHHVGDFEFTNQLGKNVTQKDFANSIYIANYIFTTCPGICKDMTRELRRVYKKFENDDRVKILSHTSKPEEDSVSVLFAYAQRQGVREPQQWQFVTGNIDSLHSIALHDYLIANPDDARDGNTFVHTERVALIDKNKHIRGFYDATSPAEVDKMMADIEKLLLE